MLRTSTRYRLAAALTSAAIVCTLTASDAPAGSGDCAQPVSGGSNPLTSDCAYVLKAAVKAAVCDLCVCDVNGDASETSADALVCLRKAIGQSVTLACPACATTTTTDPGPHVSSTTTSTTSTTTTLPVRCVENADCAALPVAFRCNPNTGTCEKPCTRNSQCKDFYECNKITQYCQEPALLF